MTVLQKEDIYVLFGLEANAFERSRERMGHRFWRREFEKRVVSSDSFEGTAKMAGSVSVDAPLDTIQEYVFLSVRWTPFDTRLVVIFAFTRTGLSRTVSNSSTGVSVVTEHQHGEDVGDEEEEGFYYPSDGEEEDPEEVVNREQAAHDTHPDQDRHSVDEDLKYPGSPVNFTDPDAEAQTSGTATNGSEEPAPPAHASPAQLEALHSAGLSGDIVLLKNLVRNSTADGRLEVFNLVNDPSPRAGSTAMHASASRGHVEPLKWCT